MTGAVDLLAGWRSTGGFLFEQRGAGVLGAGEALRATVAPGADHVARAAALAEGLLAQARVAGALVAGALPYAGDLAATLVVPAHATVTGQGVREVFVGTGSTESPVLEAGSHEPFALGAWRSLPPRDTYAAAVREATRLIGAGALSKVVLSRAIVARQRGAVELHPLLSRLRRANPDCHTFAAPDGRGGVFLGSSPETLVRRVGDRVLSFPAAGTASRSSDPTTDRLHADALLRSAKERFEHSVVVEAIADALAPVCISLRVDREPRLIATSAVWHLATTVQGTLRSSAPNALGLAALLHPSPAVCGSPRDVAQGIIERLESASRGLYSGIVGWVDDRGDGEWAISLRCATVGSGLIRLNAGGGIVAGSDPDAELAETDDKFRTMLEALSLPP
jgi:isochorismate synthase